jgi:hypothetical protein
MADEALATYALDAVRRHRFECRAFVQRPVAQSSRTELRMLANSPFLNGPDPVAPGLIRFSPHR